VNLIEHKKARLNYEVLDTYEAGIELLGPEVKSLRAHQGKLEGAHVVVRPSGRAGSYEAYIVGMTISPFQPSNTAKDYDPNRTRRLLLGKKELTELAGFEHQKGLTVVPLSVYSKGRYVKLSVAVARGRKKYDKREVLKERDAKREVDRTLKIR